MLLLTRSPKYLWYLQLEMGDRAGRGSLLQVVPSTAVERDKIELAYYGTTCHATRGPGMEC